MTRGCPGNWSEPSRGGLEKGQVVDVVASGIVEDQMAWPPGMFEVVRAKHCVDGEVVGLWKQQHVGLECASVCVQDPYFAVLGELALPLEVEVTRLRALGLFP